METEIEKMSEPRLVNWVTDEKFKNIWAGKQGLIIGSGLRGIYEDHLPQKELLASFPGKIIGCNESFLLLDPGDIDLIIWIDNLVWAYPKHQPLIVQHNCLKMCIDPFDWKGDYLNMDVIGLRANMPARFSDSFDTGFYPCNQTGYLALNVAILMGLNPIWLYGFDANQEPYHQKTSENFPMAKDWTLRHGKKIYIANKDSFLCTLFEYKPLPHDNNREGEGIKTEEDLIKNGPRQ